MALSAALHASIFALGWVSTLYEPPVLVFETYEIELVSPPPAVRAQEDRPATEEIVVERPDPQPEPPAPEPEEVVPVQDPEPEPDPPPEDPAEEMPPEVAEETVEAATVAEVPEERETNVSGEDINVRIEGLRRDYPAYYANIIRQIQRCFVSRWRQGGRWETTLFFYIDRDGTVPGDETRFVTRSGNTAFDYTAMGAIECAGRGNFGPLPAELPYDRFPVRFTFRPQNAPFPLVPEWGARPPQPGHGEARHHP